MTALAIILGIVVSSIIVGGSLTWLRGSFDKPKYPQETFRVGTPGGDAIVVGYLRCYHQGGGVLTFLNADGMHIETFSPSGWLRVHKISEEITK